MRRIVVKPALMTFLVAVIDLFSSQVSGWSMNSWMKAGLV